MDAKNLKPPEEWLAQAEYDMDTAADLFRAGRYIYTIFMCHLSIEKALKGLYRKTFEKEPPKTHDLGYLSREIKLEPPREIALFIGRLDGLSVITRYPEDLARILTGVGKLDTKTVLDTGKEALSWLKKQY